MDVLTREQAVLTYIDGATGERTALTGPVLGGWVARTARLLREGCGLGVGARAAVLLPPHWQTAAVLLGAWTAGVAVSFRPLATAGLSQTDRGPFDVVFVARDRVDNWIDEVPQAPHRLVQGVVEIGEHPAAVGKASLVLLRPAWCLDHAIERLEKGADDLTHRRLLRAPQPRSGRCRSCASSSSLRMLAWPGPCQDCCWPAAAHAA